ncbi:benzoylformate decarboxylase [Emcibacter nanhaiensis]|uniref:Benzoylformate decarboxylase n=1 Tax=Emcibacter nanhaiensis TaxID=1505037 RepID=A0A501PCK9_9PROT|nr:benzoylformate decarboxylase [Emcibacter nanhaiensis]TPD57908.1 benzoylformate decarboxylase [Emcibacter nanhaiensis]
MGNTAMTSTVREEVYRLFRHMGVDRVFGNPGSTELPMFRDFPEDFDYVLGLQESIVVGMADGYAQARRRPAVVNLHSAAGVGHALGNLFTAWKNQTPVVVIAGQQARSILPYEPFLFASEATEFPKPYVKWSNEPARAEDVPQAIARAFHMALQPPHGPVFVSVPVDDWDQPCAPLELRRVSQSLQGDAGMLAEAAEALADSKKPLFVVGAEVARDDAWDEVIQLAERHRAPVWASPMSARNSFPEDHDLFAGFLPAMREKIVERLDGHDLILVLGGPVFPYHVEGQGPHIPEDATLYQLTCDPAQAALSPVGTAIQTSLKAGIAALLAGPAPGSEREMPTPRPTPEEATGQRLTDVFLLQSLAKLRPEGSIVVEEAPSSRPVMQANLPMPNRDGFYTTASGGLGHGLPAAVGVALGRPGERVIALLGDGSSLYAIQGLWSAAQLGLPISFIIVNNGAYQALNSFAPQFGLQQLVGTQLPGLDFCALAEGQGVPATRVSDPADLKEALLNSFGASGPTLIDVQVEE